MRGITITFIFALILAIGFGTYFLMRPDTNVTPPATENPFGAATNEPSTQTTSGQNTTLYFTDGSTKSVPSFTEANQPEWASADAGYEVAGSEMSAYQILFYPEGSGILVSLLEEPLGENRKKAEAALRQKLNLTNDEMCKLSYQVSVNRSVNEQYAGMDLGFSFCPNAVRLP